MNRLDKKQIFIGTILGIILSILTLILLTRNIQLLSAQQTQQKYTVFKTENQGFKFIKKDIVGYEYKWVEDPSRSRLYITGPFYQLPCDKKWNEAECPNIVPMSSPIASDANVAYDIDGGCNWQNCWINYRGYVYRASSGGQPSGYYRDASLDFGVDYNSNERKFWYPGKSGKVGELALCDRSWSEFECLGKKEAQGSNDGYDVKIYAVGNKITLEAKYVKVTSLPIFYEALAPIFAQTPNEYSLGNQVATKEYVDSKSGISIIEEDIQTGVKYTISGPICAEEYGVYIYEKNGNYGEIYFTSMTGRSNYFHLNLDNREGGRWFVNYNCGGWGACDTIAQKISGGYYYGNQLAFLVAQWNWNRADKVYISGSGLGFTEINKNDSKIIWKTGRKFLGNNYGCGRNWSLEVRAISNYTPTQVFSSLTLPSNLAISRGNLGSGKIVRKYLGDSLIALIVNNTNETRTTVDVPLADVIQLCGDIDGCSLYFYKRYRTSNETYEIEGPVLFRYDISTKKWVSGYVGNRRLAAGTDGDGNTQHIWRPMNCYFTDGEYIDGNNRGDSYIGLGLLDWDPNENRYCYLVIKD